MSRRKPFNPADYPGYFKRRKDSMIIKLNNVRLAFPSLFEPSLTPLSKPGDPPKYRAKFLVSKGSPLDKEIEAAILDTAETKWGAGKGAAIIKSIRGNNNKFCYQDGDNIDFDGYSGMKVLGSASPATARPLVTGRRKEVLTAADGRIYAGCYVNASVEIYGYDNGGKGITAQLRGVQFVRDGDAFAGGRPASPNEFDDLGVEEDESESVL